SKIEFVPLSFLPLATTVLISQANTSLAVSQSGETDSYTVALSTRPTANVTVAIAPDIGLAVYPSALTFTPDNWDIPQPVIVGVASESIAQSDQFGTIAHVTSSSDPNCDGIHVADVIVKIVGSEAPIRDLSWQ